MRLALAILVIAACGVDSDVNRVLGARCDTKDECQERCLVDAVGYPGGLCSVSCLAQRDCPGDAACVADEGGVCLFSCAVDADCEFLGPGWFCQARPGLPADTGEVMVCLGD